MCEWQTAHRGLTQEWFIELSYYKLGRGVHDRFHIYTTICVGDFTSPGIDTL